VPCPLLSREVITLFHYFFLLCSRENRTNHHVGRGAPLWIKGWCRSLQDLPSASWYYPQEWLYSHQEPSLQGLISSFFLSFFLCSCYGFYLGFCFFFPDLSVLFVNWLLSHAIYKGDLKKIQKVIFIRVNTWICLELIISFWGCFKKEKKRELILMLMVYPENCSSPVGVLCV
jgi:hypothetical protein